MTNIYIQVLHQTITTFYVIQKRYQTIYEQITSSKMFNFFINEIEFPCLIYPFLIQIQSVRHPLIGKTQSLHHLSFQRYIPQSHTPSCTKYTSTWRSIVRQTIYTTTSISPLTYTPSYHICNGLNIPWKGQHNSINQHSCQIKVSQTVYLK